MVDLDLAQAAVLYKSQMSQVVTLEEKIDQALNSVLVQI